MRVKYRYARSEDGLKATGGAVAVGWLSRGSEHGVVYTTVYHIHLFLLKGLILPDQRHNEGDLDLVAFALADQRELRIEAYDTRTGVVAEAE